MALCPTTAPSQTRLCLRMGFTMFNRLAASLATPVDPDPDPDATITLSYEEFSSAVDKLNLIGFPTSAAPKRRGRTFGAGGSTTRVRPTVLRTPSRRPSRRGRAPA